MSTITLQEVQRLPTSGARAAVPFELDGQAFLVIPQLAEDVEGAVPNMNGGTSNVDALVYRWKPQSNGGLFELVQRIPVHGGESACVFTIDDRHFLAIANIRSGVEPDFNYLPESVLYEWNGCQFAEFQKFPTFAAKQCHAFQFDDHFFLAFAEVVSPPNEPVADGRSHVYVWNGSSFELFQALPSTWGYGFTYFPCDGQHFLALADHGQASVVYRWNGVSFEAFQSIAESGGGRHFLAFDVLDEHYLAFANLLAPSELYRWTGQRFDLVQSLAGPGARNFHCWKKRDDVFVFRTNFITGDRSTPNTAMNSEVYRFANGHLEMVGSYPTCGGTESAPVVLDGKPYLIVSNSLSKTVRFRTDSVVYRIIIDEPAPAGS